MRKLLFIFLILAFGFSNSFANTTWIPVDFQKWRAVETPTTFRSRIGGLLANYPKEDNTWEAIDNNWVAGGDSAFNIKDILKTSVKRTGESYVKVTWGGAEYVLTQKLKKLIWIKVSTLGWVDVFDSTSNWSAVSVDSNIIKWTNIFPGVDYRVRKTNATVAHGIFFKKVFLDSAVALYNKRADSLDIGLGNVMVYTLSSTIDDYDSALGSVDKRRLKQLGKYAFELSEQSVIFPGSDTLPQLRVKQLWQKKDNKLYCVEYVMMSKIKQIHKAYPNAVVWHNDTKKIEGTTNVEDVEIGDYYLDRQNGQSEETVIETHYGVHNQYDGVLIRPKNITSELGAGATNITATCSLYCVVNLHDDDISAYRVFKPWVEGILDGATCTGTGNGATGNDWDCLSLEWGTILCANTSDAGSDNSGDGTDYDRKSTAESNVSVTTVNTWYSWSISTELATGWYDGTIGERGIILLGSIDEGRNDFYSTEYTTDPTLCPFFVFTYDVAPSDTALLRIKDDWRFIPSFVMDWRFQDSIQVAQVQKIFHGGADAIDTMYSNGVVQNIFK